MCKEVKFSKIEYNNDLMVPNNERWILIRNSDENGNILNAKIIKKDGISSYDIGDITKFIFQYNKTHDDIIVLDDNGYRKCVAPAIMLYRGSHAEDFLTENTNLIIVDERFDTKITNK